MNKAFDLDKIILTVVFISILSFLMYFLTGGVL